LILRLLRRARELLAVCFCAPRVIQWAAPLRKLRSLYGWRPNLVSLWDAHEILVIRPDEIGDVVLTSPFLRELRRAAPHARITLLVKPACLELVEHCPHVDSVHAFEFGGRARLLLDVWRLRLSHLPLRGFDLVLLPRCDIDWYNSELIAHLLAGRGAVVVHRGSHLSASLRGTGRRHMFPTEVYSNPGIAHEATQPLRFLEWCGASTIDNARLELWIPDVDRSAARARLARDLPRQAPLVVIHPSGGRSRLKQWPVERFRHLLEQLKLETICNFLIVGGKDEDWIEVEFSMAVCERVALAVGRFTLRQLGAVLADAQLFVGGDSGPMHLAAAAGTAVVAILGSTSEVRFGPRGNLCHVVSLRYPCNPDVLGTFEARCSSCRFAEPRCLTELPVEAVLAQAHAVLARPRVSTEAAFHAQPVRR
jgi:ADP-heptose:LPS heptosyltransferase